MINSRQKIKKLKDDVLFLQNRINDMEKEHTGNLLKMKIEHEKELSKAVWEGVKSAGHWKIQFDALDKEKDQWSEDARRLQDRIDTHERLQYNEKFLGLVRAVKYLNEFKIPQNA